MGQASENNKIYEFADFRLIPGEELLLRDGEPITLNPKAFAMLTLLVERHGHLVSKSDMNDAIWDGCFVEEGVISKAVWFVRNALGDASKERFIQTVPRRGYRFVAPVSVLNEISGSFARPISTGYRLTDLDEAVASAQKASKFAEPPVEGNGNGRSLDVDLTGTGQYIDEFDTRQRRQVFRPWHRSVLVWTGLALSVLIGSGYFIYAPTTTADASPKKLAILPLTPIDPENRNALYEVGIADSLISRFGSVKGLTVRSLSSVRKYSEMEQDPVVAGREQKVDYVLASTYQLADGKIRVTSKLINVETGEVEETSKFEKETSSMFAVQDAFATDLGDRLIARFNATPGGRIKTIGTTNEEAYRLYLLGTNLNDKQGTYSIKAVEYLTQAVALDPNYADAWAGKALVHSSLAWNHPDAKVEQFQNSTEAINRALALDPNLSEAYAVRCENTFFYNYDLDGAEVACKRALELDPKSSNAHRMYNLLLISRGRYEEALAEIKTAIDLEPRSFRNQRQLANTLYGARRYEEAAEQYRRSIDFNPDNVAPYRRLIRTLEALGKESEAFPYLIQLSAVEKKTPEVIERFKAVYATSGWRGVIAERIKAAEGEDRGYFLIAEWYAALDNKDKALEYLEKAYQQRSQLMILFPEESHHFDSLKDDPRAADLIRRVEGK